MFGLFKKSYKIRVDEHRVYVKWNRRIEMWKPEENDRYLPELQAAVRKTVGADVWQMLSERGTYDNKDYCDYVETVKALLIKEYGLDPKADKVETAGYHLDMLIIDFVAKKGVTYPYYYRGVQLKPYVETKA